MGLVVAQLNPPFHSIPFRGCTGEISTACKSRFASPHASKAVALDRTEVGNTGGATNFA